MALIFAGCIIPYATLSSVSGWPLGFQVSRGVWLRQVAGLQASGLFDVAA